MILIVVNFTYFVSNAGQKCSVYFHAFLPSSSKFYHAFSPVPTMFSTLTDCLRKTTQSFLQEKGEESSPKCLSSLYKQSYKSLLMTFFPMTLFLTKNFDSFSMTFFPIFLD